MKKYALFFAFLAITISCNKNIDAPNTNNDININLDPSQRFIHFDVDINTRGALIEGNLLADDFAVLGYQYPGTWDAEKVFATPNVFYKNKEKTEPAKPQIVTYDANEGVFSYNPIQIWSGNKYSFFGYYPKAHTNITLNAEQGEPYIFYNLSGIDSDPTKLIDLMTASYIDTGVASSASVAMEFHHRLAAIDIGARNYYEVDHDNDPNTDPKKVTIEISNLELNLEGIYSESAKIYLNQAIPTELNKYSTPKSISFNMVGPETNWAPETFDVEPNTSTDRSIRLVKKKTGEVTSTLILLPQEELLQGTVALTYKKKITDDNGTLLYQRVNLDDNGNTFYTWTELPTDTNSHMYYEFKPNLQINFSKELIEGRRYFIELTFTADAVSVNIIAADEWDTLPDIKHEFE